MESHGIRVRTGDILYGIMKRRVLIIALTVAGLIIGIVLSGVSYLRGEMSKDYVVTSSFSVNTRTNSGLFTSGYDFPNYSDITLAEDITDAVTYVLKSDKMLTEVIGSLGLADVTAKDIKDNLKMERYNETQIIEVSLYWRSAQEGMDILSEINRLAPEILQETLNIGNVSVINAPSSKYLVAGRLNMIMWGYMAILGFGLGIGITMLELIMHPTLLNVRDVENLFGLEVLCEIADDKAYFDKKRSLLTEEEEHTEVGDRFSSAAHIIHNRLKKQPKPQIIYITSALRGEGKTSILANLAIQLSDLEKRVLLVDFDMKNPKLGGFFLSNVEYDHSLNALYAGDITQEDAITALTGYLDLIPTVLESNSIPLDSNLFSVIQKIAADYDYVLIDTAPVGLTADPMSLSQIVSGALFVARYDTASMQEIRSALDRIEKSGVGVLGCVVNCVQVSERGINNPAKDKMRKAGHPTVYEGELMTNLNDQLYSDFSHGGRGRGDRFMVAEFMGDTDYKDPDDSAEVTTDDSFVEQLFMAENNLRDEDQETQADQE